MAENTQDYQATSHFYSSRDGLKLHVREHAPVQPSGHLPVICLPGLSRNARDFKGLAMTLASDPVKPRSVFAFDYRGRGVSAYDSEWKNYNVLTEAEDVVNGLTALGIEHGIFVGTSRGGLISFVLAGMRPGAIKGIVLNDIGPVIEGAGLMQIKGYLQRRPQPRTMAEAVLAQKTLMEKSFPAFTDKDWEYEAASRYSNVDGVIKADYDPKLSNTLNALDSTARLPTAWPQFAGLKNVPCLLIRGENSNILSRETAEQMKDFHPDLELMEIKGQGHAPMLHTSDIPKRIGSLCARLDH